MTTNSKFVKFPQVKLEGDTKVNVIKLEGFVYLRPENIISVTNILDKYDVPIEGVCRIGVLQLGAFDAALNVDEVVAIIDEHLT